MLALKCFFCPQVQQSCNSSSSSPDTSEEPCPTDMVKMTKSKTFQAYLPSCHRTYSCIHCRAHLANHDELISKLRVLEAHSLLVQAGRRTWETALPPDLVLTARSQRVILEASVLLRSPWERLKRGNIPGPQHQPFQADYVTKEKMTPWSGVFHDTLPSAGRLGH
ncbi:Protein yippee-like 1, partial [Dissostichus eleginoides]